MRYVETTNCKSCPSISDFSASSATNGIFFTLFGEGHEAVMKVVLMIGLICGIFITIVTMIIVVMLKRNAGDNSENSDNGAAQTPSDPTDKPADAASGGDDSEKKNSSTKGMTVVRELKSAADKPKRRHKRRPKRIRNTEENVPLHSPTNPVTDTRVDEPPKTQGDDVLIELENL